METRFPQIRRRAILTILVASLCFGLAGIAAGAFSAWALPPLIAGTVLFFTVPFGAGRKLPANPPDTNWLRMLLDLLRTFSVSMFLAFQPGMSDLFEWLSQGKLLHWPFLLVVAVFTASLARRLCARIQALTDLEIYEYYRNSETALQTNATR